MGASVFLISARLTAKIRNSILRSRLRFAFLSIPVNIEAITWIGFVVGSSAPSLIRTINPLIPSLSFIVNISTIAFYNFIYYNLRIISSSCPRII